MSPSHTRSVALVMNPRTGLVSPQYHVKFDDLFETVRGRTEGEESQWLVATRFSKSRRKKQLNSHLPVPRIHQEVTEEVEDIEIDPEPGDKKASELPEALPPEPEGLRRSTREVKPPERYVAGFLACFQCLYSAPDPTLGMEDPMHYCMASSSDADIMNLTEAMKAPDRKQFLQAMVKEMTAHDTGKHWALFRRSQLPKGTKVFPAVWALRRKRRIVSGQVYKWKARINVHGGRQEFGVNYWETYSPVVSWYAIRFFLTLSIINLWHSRQIDFVLAFPQAPIECEMYMEVPRGFTVKGERKSFCLKLISNLYGQKQAGRVWNQFLHQGLEERGFSRSKVNQCVYTKGSIILFVYVDDAVILSP